MCEYARDKRLRMIFEMWRSTHVIFHLVKKPLVLVKNDPQQTIWLRKVTIYLII